MIAAVIFSRDRACQLDLLLRSLTVNAPGIFDPVTVIWRATAEQFTEAYGRCMAEHPRTRFLREDGLTYQTRSLIAKAESLVCFFTDDDVLHRPLDENGAVLHEHALDREDVLSFSLRLGRNTTVCYPHGRRQRLPQIRWGGDLMLWEWEAADQDFSYPCSLDGHLYRKEDLLVLLDGQHFTTPNFLEDVLMREPQRLRRPLMAAYGESRIVSVPANKVTESHLGNRHGQEHPASAAELNARYLAGGRIDLAAMDFSSVCGAHHELPFVFA